MFSLTGGIYVVKMNQLPFMGLVCTVMLFIVYKTTNFQYQHAEMETRLHPFDTIKESDVASIKVDHLPQGIVQASSDMELRPLWLTNSSSLKDGETRFISPTPLWWKLAYVNDDDDNEIYQVDVSSHQNLLAIPAGIRQKQNVDNMVQKFLPENFTVIIFHYDGNVNGWEDLKWSKKAIHVVAHNQTKWWFAKRFLHPDVVSIYDYIFLWDEDLGVENFHPARYLKIMKSEGLEISQPALDANSSEIHHRITIRRKMKKFHRKVYDIRGSVKCSDSSEGPPCSGWVEGMAPVFSRSAWHCAWHLIQNDLVHGWGMDMKLGYCAKGDRSKKVGVIDSEFIVHQGIQTLGGSLARKASKDKTREGSTKRNGDVAVDMRSEIRRQSTSELQIFRKRWDKAVKEDKDWIDPYRKRTRPSHSRKSIMLQKTF